MSDPHGQLKGLRILVAEDEILILLDIEEMLHEFGCEIIGPAATVAATLAAIRGNEMDGALLDRSLRGERVTPAAEELLARGVPFVLCTGFGPDPRDEAAIRDAPRLAKPFSKASLGSLMQHTFVPVIRP